MATTGVYWCFVLAKCLGLVVSAITSYEQSPPIACPGNKLVFTCVTDGSVRWRINGNNLQTVLMIDTSPPTTLGSFLLNVTQHNGNTGELVSTATNNSAPVSLNGTSIDCSGDGGGTFTRKYTRIN
ncbi:PREDICTED: uncharacterized protein LOC109582738 [Amphimedon queenslandica]|uniref:Ig-like domain-containing protein n=1 Tax=Amphimedon queenslandica TaxID=400682 RepID=A0AAN0J8Z9_AMPQE|nr:PREDICTED: uncharacterized protein LOC109582738 [Amphimedon queenslandica]|eukprot:XP_019853206.1 PREDICTED: uncharacterized protein LOC109582738 [Amphimedon queenslandica]